MATRFFSISRSVLTNKQALTSFLSRYYSISSPSTSLAVSQFSPLRLRSLVAAAHLFQGASPASVAGFRAFSTRSTQSSLNDSSPNWSNRPPKETILLDGCDFEHWLVVLEKPDESLTRDEIIDSYIKTLAQIVGSEDEARMKIYSVSTKHYFAFGALVSEELSYKLKELPNVRWVLPDSYLDVRNKDYGGEPFIDGQAVPYDPKYHEEWVRNNAKAMDRNRRNDRPRNFDRSRNFERRRQNGPPQGGGGMPPNNMGGGPGGEMPPNNMGGPPNMVGQPPSGGVPFNNNEGIRGPPNAGWQVNAQAPPQNFQNPQGPPRNFQNPQGPPQNFQNSQGPPQSYPNSQGPPPNYPNSQGPPPSNYQNPPRNYQNPQGPPRDYQNSQGPPRDYQNPQGPPPNYRNYGPPGGNQYQSQDMPPPQQRNY